MNSISVVVPTYNSGRVLHDCLASLVSQTHAPAEVIVSDNQSTDSTREIARSLGARVIVAGSERSAQRNAGARISKGTYLLFVDSDMVLTPGVVQECIEVASRGADAAVIPESVVGRTYWARCRNLEKRLSEGVPGYEAARLISRRLFFEVGGFDETLVAGEDFDLHMSLEDAGAKVARLQSAILHMEPHYSIRDYVRKWLYYSGTLAPFVDKRGDARRRTVSLPRIMWFRRRLLVDMPSLVPGLLLLKAVEFAVLGWRLRFSKPSKRRTASGD